MMAEQIIMTDGPVDTGQQKSLSYLLLLSFPSKKSRLPSGVP